VRRQPLAFQRRKVGQQTPGRRQVGRRRQIQPAELGRILASPLQQLQQQRRQIALQNFRVALRRRAFGLLFASRCRQIPGSRRPARPARWVIDAWLMRCVTRRVSPVRASKRATLLGAIHHQPNPSMVRLVSAILVASTTLRIPAGAGSIALRCSLSGSAPYSGQRITSRHPLRQLLLNALDLSHAGQKQQHRAIFAAQQLRGGHRHRLVKTLMGGSG
jgi:hypothetical protein